MNIRDRLTRKGRCPLADVTAVAGVLAEWTAHLRARRVSAVLVALALAAFALAVGGLPLLPADVDLLLLNAAEFGSGDEILAGLATRPAGQAMHGTALSIEPLDRRSAEAPRPRQIGCFVGEVSKRHHSAELVAWLADLPKHLASAQRLSQGRNTNLRIEAPISGRAREVLVKAFGRVPAMHHARTRRRGSKARRSWLAAEFLDRHSVGTPEPVAYLERWERGRLQASYFISVFIDDAETLRDGLARLLEQDPACEQFMALLECTAKGVRAMHDAGFLHHDLGNTNILLRRDGTGRWCDFRVVDLNRGRMCREVGMRDRARDLSRLTLPSHLRSVFVRMYWQSTPPHELLVWERRYVRLHRWWVQSRRYRHPIREARLRQAAQEPGHVRLRSPRDWWIWDERTGQPFAPMLRHERRSHYPATRLPRMIVDTVRAMAAVWRRYGLLRDQAFTRPVELAGRIGMAVEASGVAPEREIELLAGLGRIPVLVRCCHHETPSRRAQRFALVRALHRAGHAVAIALVQDRRAVTEPEAWRAFVNEVLAEVGSLVELVEVGHSVNRTKWGIWSFEELAKLYAPLLELHAQYPAIRFVGPATIDFEYPFAIAALRQWPANVPLAASAQHLYLDRRGAPETPQGRLGPIDKFALARALACVAPNCEDRLIVSEANWPLAGMAPHCPVSPPYLLPAHQSGKAAVSEDTYGNYMLRYLCLAIASGLVDRVYWWRLVARGFGLVDDADPHALRRRPAYHMLARFLDVLGDSRFESASLPPRQRAGQGQYRFAFRRRDGESVVLAYAHGGEDALVAECRRAEDAFGNALDGPLRLTARPIYLRDCPT